MGAQSAFSLKESMKWKPLAPRFRPVRSPLDAISSHLLSRERSWGVVARRADVTGGSVWAPLVPASSPHQLTLTDDPLAPRPLQRISPIPTASLQSAHPLEESIVQVYAGGCLHNAIRRNTDGTSAAPLKLSNEESKRRISETWCFYLNRFDSRAKSPFITHCLVVSMSKHLL